MDTIERARRADFLFGANGSDSNNSGYGGYNACYGYPGQPLEVGPCAQFYVYSNNSGYGGYGACYGYPGQPLEDDIGMLVDEEGLGGDYRPIRFDQPRFQLQPQRLPPRQSGPPSPRRPPPPPPLQPFHVPTSYNPPLPYYNHRYRRYLSEDDLATDFDSYQKSRWAKNARWGRSQGQRY